jgi:phytoene dehydrogenase-like protein/NAD(P)H-flavin reductase
MTCGAILTKLNKKRVLILERHFEIGGLTHVFSRGRYKWEVGVHYIGRMKEGMIQRAVFDYITNKRIKWLPISDPFERFIFKDFSFNVSATKKRFRKDLIKQFPSNKKEIEKYLRDIDKSANWFVRRYLSGFLPKPLSWLIRLINFFTRKTPLTTTETYMENNISDKNLAAVLTSQWGDYGTPPDESSFVMHAALVKHFIDGGFFPEGGSQRIAGTIENVIEQNGGMILVNRDVKEIIVKDNRAVGVRVIDNRFTAVREEIFHAPYIISNAGAENTYRKLLGTIPSISKIKNRMQLLEKGYSAITLYIGLKESPEKLNVRGENYWINTQNTQTGMREMTQALLDNNPTTCYVSFPSLRAKQDLNHIAVVIALVDYKVFVKWKNQKWRFRNTSYYNFKDTIAASLISLADKHIAGFANLVDYCEVSTPLTMEYFTNRESGSMYGFKQTPGYYRNSIFDVKTPVKGLYLSGTDVCSAGVTGAMMGGVAAASAVNGPLGLFKIVASARVEAHKRYSAYEIPSPRSFRPSYSQSSDKVLAQLVNKLQLTDSIYEFSYQLPKDVDFCPGQYARIQYGDAEYGSYSIVNENNRLIRFIIETKFGGLYAKYFKSLKPGDYSTIRLPLGDFTFRQSNNRKVFISTGTGIAPQIAMITQAAKDSFDEHIDVYFGCRYAKDNFINRYLRNIEESFTINSKICISREKKEGYIHGRVTKPINAVVGNLEDNDFYISGNPAMVADTVKLLRKKGASNIYSENY